MTHGTPGKKSSLQANVGPTIKERIKEWVWMVAISVCSVTVSWLATNFIPVNSVMASAMVGLCGSILLEKHSQTIAYSASFAGMSSLEILPSILWVILAGVIVAIIFILAHGHFHGVGGKLGTIALCSVLLTKGILFLSDRNNKQKEVTISRGFARAESLRTLDWVLLPLSAMFGASATHSAFTKLPDITTTTRASSLVGLLGSLFILSLPNLVHQSSDVLQNLLQQRPINPGGLYAGTFAGMACEKRIKGGLLGYSLTGLLTGLIFVPVQMLLQGDYGGKAGFSAFLAVLAVDYSCKACKKLFYGVGDCSQEQIHKENQERVPLLGYDSPAQISIHVTTTNSQ